MLPSQGLLTGSCAVCSWPGASCCDELPTAGRPAMQTKHVALQQQGAAPQGTTLPLCAAPVVFSLHPLTIRRLQALLFCFFALLTHLNPSTCLLLADAALCNQGRTSAPTPLQAPLESALHVSGRCGLVWAAQRRTPFHLIMLGTPGGA